MKTTRVAVIGAGLAGLSTARALAGQGVEVQLFEAEPVMGGSVFGVDVPTSTGGTVRVDGGIADFNLSTAPELKALLSELSSELMPISQDASYLRADGSSVLSVISGQPVYETASAQQQNEAQFQELLRFRREAAEVLSDVRLEKATVGQYLVLRGYSEAFIREVFAGRARAVHSMPEVKLVHYPMRSLLKHWSNLGAVGANQATRVTLRGGLHRMVPVLQQQLMQLGVDVRTSTRVVLVSRKNRGSVEVRSIDSSDVRQVHTVDQVVFAVSPAVALHLLDDASNQERDALLQVPMHKAEVVVHTDAQVMPVTRALWGALNHRAADEAKACMPTLTRYVNRHSRLGPEVEDVFVTLNPPVAINEAEVLQRRFFSYPQALKKSAEAVRQLEALQGRHRTWFAAGWLLEPWVAESAVVSGLRIAERLLEGVSQRTRSEPVDQQKATRASKTLTVGEARYLALSASAISYQSVVTVAGVQRSSVDWLWPAGVPVPAEGTVLYFGTPLIDSYGFSVQSAKVLGLTAPGEVRTSSLKAHSIETRRLDARAAIRWPAVLRVRQSVIRCRTENVSTTGALLVFEQPLTPAQVRQWAGTPVRLELTFPGRGAPLVMSATPARWLEAQAPLHSVAVAFRPEFELDRSELELAVLRATSRREPRVAVSIPCALALPDEEFGVASVVNLSATGARIQMDPSMAARLVEQMSETGQQFLKLRMSLPTAPLLNFDVSVIRKSAAAKRAVWAVQFDATDSKTRMAVATHVLRVLREK